MPEVFDDEPPQEEGADEHLLYEAQAEAALILSKHLPSVRAYDEDRPGETLADRLRLELAIIDNDDRERNQIPRIGRERFAYRIVIAILLQETEERISHVGRHTRRSVERIRIDDAIAHRVVTSLDPDTKRYLADHFIPGAVDTFSAHLEQLGLYEHISGAQRQLQNLYFELVSEELFGEETD